MRELETGIMAILLKCQIDTEMAKWLKMAILGVSGGTETKSYPYGHVSAIFVLDAFRCLSGHLLTSLAISGLAIIDWPRVYWFIRANMAICRH